VNAGAPLAGVAHILGHKHISTTAIYVKTNDAPALAALEAVAPRAGGALWGAVVKKGEARDHTPSQKDLK
jgi:hypothetical protein